MVAARWHVGHGRHLDLGAKARVMGVLNVTPDSFSDGGRFTALDRAVSHAAAMVAAGADIVDVGGESTRPGAGAIDAAEEQRRVLPVIEALVATTGALVSVDTYREETARLAVRAGAHIVNDIWGLQREPGIGRVVAETGAALVLMHNSRERTVLPDPVDDQRSFLGRSLELAAQAGVGRECIVVDPGFGFGKEAEENLTLMARFSELRSLGLPLLVGTSRKRFLGHLTGREAADRDVATAATSVVLRLAGADLFRVHDVAINVDALAVADAMLARQEGAGG